MLGTEQAELCPLRSSVVAAIVAWAAGGKGMAAAMRKQGGQKLLRVLCRTLAADAATVAEACTGALMRISQHYPLEVGLALKAAPDALPRLLVQLEGKVRTLLGGFKCSTLQASASQAAPDQPLVKHSPHLQPAPPNPQVGAADTTAEVAARVLAQVAEGSEARRAIMGCDDAAKILVGCVAGLGFGVGLVCSCGTSSSHPPFSHLL